MHQPFSSWIAISSFIKLPYVVFLYPFWLYFTEVSCFTKLNKHIDKKMLNVYFLVYGMYDFEKRRMIFGIYFYLIFVALKKAGGLLLMVLLDV